MKRLAVVGHPGAPRDRLAKGLRSANHKSFMIFFYATATELRVVHIVRAARDLRMLDYADESDDTCD